MMIKAKLLDSRRASRPFVLPYKNDNALFAVNDGMCLAPIEIAFICLHANATQLRAQTEAPKYQQQQ